MPIHNASTFDSNPKLLKGNVQIIASAGSGKTEFVSERIATQIANGIAKPSEIVALTFNDAAAEELKFRVRDKIKLLLGKQPDIGDMYIGTIHAFSFMILQEFVPRYRGYDMLDENSRKAFAVSIRWQDELNISVLYRGLQKRNFSLPYGSEWDNWTLETFLKDVDFYREESLDESYTDSNSFKIALSVYQNNLEERRFLDFSGILRLAVDHLEGDTYALKEIQKRYKFYTIDEYQDVNPIQEKLIRLVSGQKNVCVVGDDDQSIYQWRGADISNILNFKKNYKGVTTFKLQVNRRSHNNIVLCASDFIKRNSNRFKKAIKPNTALSQPGDLYKIVFERQEEEIDWIIEKIEALYGKEYNDNGPRKIMYSDMVLLFRRRSEAHAYKDALENNGINVIYSGMGGLLEAEEIQMLQQVFKHIGENVASSVPTISDSLDSIYGLVKDFSTITKKDFKKLIVDEIKWVNGQKRLSMQQFYYRILSGLGLADESFHDDEDDVVLYNLGKFSKVISDFEGSRTYCSKNDILRFVKYIDTFVSNAYDEGSTDSQEGLVDAVKIMTLHGTKGLGFPVVFIPSLKKPRANNSERVTFLDKSKIDFSRYGGSREDERRLYYVAITRAKKFLFLSTYHYKLEAKKRSGIHDFWCEIDDKYFITANITDPTIRLNCAIQRIDSDVRFPTSYSELSYYLSCSYDYRMRFVYGFNPELVQALGYGKQVHNLINMLHKEFERTRKIPNEQFIRDLIQKNFYLRYAATAQEDKLRKACQESLTNYVELWKKDFSQAVKTEQEFELDFEDKALINGSIDLLSRSSGPKDTLEIIDFKTGKSQSQFEEKYAHQVVLYTIAATEILGKEIKKAYLHYLDANQAERKELDISKKQLKETKNKLSEAIDGITANKFERKPKMGSCKQCDWKIICPKSK